MRILSKTFIICAVMLLSATSNAATIYATDISLTTNDTETTTANSNRQNAGNALGAADSKFYSLGLGGTALLEFGQLFTGPSVVFEVTFGNVSNHPEQVNVYAGNTASADINDFTLVGMISNAVAQSGAEIEFMGTFQYLLLVDNSAALGTASQDGFDIDAVSVTAVPLPAAAWLFMTAIGGLGFFGRRKS